MDYYSDLSREIAERVRGRKVHRPTRRLYEVWRENGKTRSRRLPTYATNFDLCAYAVAERFPVFTVDRADDGSYSAAVNGCVATDRIFAAAALGQAALLAIAEARK